MSEFNVKTGWPQQPWSHMCNEDNLTEDQKTEVTVLEEISDEEFMNRQRDYDAIVYPSYVEGYRYRYGQNEVQSRLTLGEEDV